MTLPPTRLRILLASALLALAIGVATDDAHAHGGSFREDAPQGPDMPTPELPPVGRPQVTTERATWTVGTWRTWWQLHRDAFLPDRRATRRRAVETASGSLFGVGDARQGGAITHWERTVERGAVVKAVPFLMGILDPQAAHDERLMAAALLALGRTVRGPAPVGLFARHASDPTAPTELRESAVLGLGLLRRSDRRLQQSPATLRDVRTFLLGQFDDKDAPTRVRSFAALSLGLLADQPYGARPFERDGRAITRALWARLQRRYPDDDLPVSLLTALGMQPRAGVPGGVLAGLKTIAMDRSFQGRRWEALQRSHALTAYARLGAPAWERIALWALRGTRDHVSMRCAAAIALARGADTFGPTERFDVAQGIARWVPREPNWFAAGLQHITLGALLRADLAAGGERLTGELGLHKTLTRGAERGRSMARPYCRLALGMAIRDLGPTTKTAALVIKDFRALLLRILRKGRGSDDALGACAAALGMGGAASAHKLLLSILEDDKRGASLRGDCALALAHIGCDTPAVRAALHKAAIERISPQVHVRAVRALAVLAVPHAAERLLASMDRTRSRYSVAVAASALGHLGDPVATPRLVALAGDPVEGLTVRVMAVVALGLIHDPESRPSRVRVTAYANYPARTPSLMQLFNIQ